MVKMLYNVIIMKNENKFAKDVNPETKRKIILAVLSSENTTRGQIAEKLGLNVITVGKVVSELISRKMANVYKNGRESEVISPPSSILVLNFRFCDDKYVFTLCDLRANHILSGEKLKNPIAIPEDDVAAFADMTAAQIAKYTTDAECMITLTADRDGERFSPILEERLGYRVCHISSSSYEVRAHAERLYPSETFLYISIDDKVNYCLFVNGIEAAPPMPSDRVAAERDELWAVEEISNTLRYLFRITSPKTVVIESDIIRTDDKFIKEIIKRLPKSNSSLSDITSDPKMPISVSQSVYRVIEGLAIELSGSER